MKGISKSKVRAYTFNAPGFKSKYKKWYMHGLSPYFKNIKDPKSAKKIKNNKKRKYFYYITNYRIKGDWVSNYYQLLGEVRKVEHKSGHDIGTAIENHRIDAFNRKNIIRRVY